MDQTVADSRQAGRSLSVATARHRRRPSGRQSSTWIMPIGDFGCISHWQAASWSEASRDHLMRRIRFSSLQRDTSPGPIPFPRQRTTTAWGISEQQQRRLDRATGGEGPAVDVFTALDAVSRRMEDLARELGCRGYCYDDDDRPRAA